MALLEETLVDPRDGRIVNANLAEYHVPVNADIGVVDDLADAARADRIVFHATGTRPRELPIRLDDFLNV